MADCSDPVVSASFALCDDSDDFTRSFARSHPTPTTTIPATATRSSPYRDCKELRDYAALAKSSAACEGELHPSAILPALLSTGTGTGLDRSITKILITEVIMPYLWPASIRPFATVSLAGSKVVSEHRNTWYGETGLAAPIRAAPYIALRLNAGGGRRVGRHKNVDIHTIK